VRDRYDALASRYDRRWSRYLDASLRATMERAGSIAPEAQVLDVGCGTGLLLARVLAEQPRAVVAGADLSAAMLARARERLPERVPLLCADVAALPFASGRFDLVLSSSSMHFWAEPQAALAELRRVLRPGGRAVITDWCDDYLACRLCDRALRWLDPAHRPILGGGQCAALLRDAECELLQLDRYRISLLWGLMTAVARVPRPAPG
jgi:ubiquinone/menaquinone biosynthesis C-methylase UbiE